MQLPTSSGVPSGRRTSNAQIRFARIVSAPHPSTAIPLTPLEEREAKRTRQELLEQASDTPPTLLSASLAASCRAAPRFALLSELAFVQPGRLVLLLGCPTIGRTPFVDSLHERLRAHRIVRATSFEFWCRHLSTRLAPARIDGCCPVGRGAHDRGGGSALAQVRHAEGCAQWMPDATFDAAAEAGVALAAGPLRQGLVTRSASAFLHSAATAGSEASRDAQRGMVEVGPETGPPGKRRAPLLPRHLGCLAANDVLERALREQGALDFRVDGVLAGGDQILLQELASDRLSDHRDGSVLDVVVGGPTLCSSFWAPGQAPLVAGDGVYVLLLADAVHVADLRALARAKAVAVPGESAEAAAAREQAKRDAEAIVAYAEARPDLPLGMHDADTTALEEPHLHAPSMAPNPELEGYLLARDRLLRAEATTKDTHEKGLQKLLDDELRTDVSRADVREAHRVVLLNFGGRRTHSAELAASGALDAPSARYDDKGRAKPGARLGLPHSKYLAPVVVGGWRVGTVVDGNAAPSRLAAAFYEADVGLPAARPDNAYGSALCVHVDVTWQSADALRAMFGG